MQAGVDQDEATAQAEAQLAAGDLRGGFAGLKAVLAADPDHPAALATMGLFLSAYGDPGQASQVLSRALARAVDPRTRGRVAAALAERLADLSPNGWHTVLDADLTVLLNEASVDPQTLARVTARTLLLKAPSFDGAVETLEALGRDPLWLAFLSRCLNVDAAMEARLNALRAALRATEGAEGEGRAALIQALALNGFAAEYLNPASGDVTPPLAWLFRAPEAGEGAGGELARRAVEQPKRERELAAGLERLTPLSDDAVSGAVRDQYEVNPYPRWATPPAPSLRSLAAVIEALPGLDRAAFGGRAETVLVAGCGTGFEPIDLARTDPGLSITAMDLSRASLAHGARVADELELYRVRFAVGDILALDRIEDRFDLVTSTGVIHHMARPQDGLARLTGVLRPGGVVRLGLYSERGRDLVKRAHALIRERGWTANPADIRAFRAHVLALPDEHPLAGLRASDDFYSLSGCRDLVFHVQEHRYTPPQLGDLLDGAGLRLIGFEASPEAEEASRQAFGATANRLDLGLWDRLEARRPTLFAGMYHLWGQRK
ncbi:methyltransferase domain-containing protein [Brevundimonas sp.]|jgi:SAM-dependent methyltransferase|uniref:methyltransferase domain-containing protein n=1 Tax=Brevundimonas sp. TaxID=1871086 RepID=UPI0037C02A5B